YRIQGEYTGAIESDGEKVPLGVQVIALGDGKFDAVVYVGGLPGAGWDGSDKIRGQGTTEGDVVKFRSDENGTAEIAAGRMTIRSQSGATLGVLNRIVRESSTLGAKPPAGARVLFDGSSAEHFERGKLAMGDLLAADCETKHKFGSHKLHIEFRTPFKPKARGQARGNSGVYIQGRYECQVLDSFGLEGENNECGGIYSISRPAVNACFPPLTWQTYDIDFTAARYDGDRKVHNARVTIRHNGIVIHKDLELPHGTPGKNPEGPGPDVIYLQGHGNPVVYRNIWVVEQD
ncbi:MAG: 3-keto-disaccharide hydrolase, partial [Planctomycetaceae bacterium]